MTKRIQIKDFANKNQTFIYDAEMTPLGCVLCECATEWAAYKADGTFINWFDSKKDAMGAL